MKRNSMLKKLNLVKETITALGDTNIGRLRGGATAPLNSCLPCYSAPPERCMTGLSCDYTCEDLC